MASILRSTPATAQAPANASSQTTPGWAVSYDTQVFLTGNVQRDKYFDSTELESQNWGMVRLQRTTPSTEFSFGAMVSLEPFTVRDRGSAQLFQTGETFQGRAMVDYQHQHDLLMQLGGTMLRRYSNWELRASADLVGEPALGPPVFMHRSSGRENLQTPLGHHNLDSSHITASVITVGLRRSWWRVDASLFAGREPDEDRVGLELKKPDSWSGRLGARWAEWSFQVSAARLRQPELLEPFDVTRWTASAEYAPTDGLRSSVLIAWGRNQHLAGNSDALLAEFTYRRTLRLQAFARGESVEKEILGVGSSHPANAFHQHPLSLVSALTVGTTYDISVRGEQRIGVGVDVTVFRVPENLRPFYQRPRSFHVFLRYRRASSSGHHHH